MSDKLWSTSVQVPPDGATFLIWQVVWVANGGVTTDAKKLDLKAKLLAKTTGGKVLENDEGAILGDVKVINGKLHIADWCCISGIIQDKEAAIAEATRLAGKAKMPYLGENAMRDIEYKESPTKQVIQATPAVLALSDASTEE